MDDSQKKKYDPQFNRNFGISPYSSDWPKLFEEEKELLTRLLGKEVVSMEHMGSTSVPGMSAKPEIDILVVVTDLDRIDKYNSVMEENGYVPKGDYTHIGERYFTRDVEGVRISNVHCIPEGSDQIPPIIDLREYLKSNKEEMEGYINCKLSLASKHSGDYSLYKREKTTYVIDLIKRAQAWRKNQ